MSVVNQAAVDLVKKWEGCVLAAYPDPATHAAPWTIGYGHTGPEVHPGLTIGQDQADAWLASDLNNAALAVQSLVAVKIGANQLGALASFVFNLGAGALHSSTMLQLINAKKFGAAADEFPKWDKANHVEMPGLKARREDERALFLAA